jgi:hypothetical protein
MAALAPMNKGATIRKAARDKQQMETIIFFWVLFSIWIWMRGTDQQFMNKMVKN